MPIHNHLHIVDRGTNDHYRVPASGGILALVRSNGNQFLLERTESIGGYVLQINPSNKSNFELGTKNNLRSVAVWDKLHLAYDSSQLASLSVQASQSLAI